MRKAKSTSVTRAAILRRIRIVELAQNIVNDMINSEIREENDVARSHAYMRGLYKTISLMRRLA